MIRQHDDRRWKTFTLHPNTIVNIFSEKIYEYFNRLRIVNLPPDFVIDNLFYEEMNQAFRFVIYHPSFDVVPMDEIPPQVEIQLTVETNPSISSQSVSP